MDIDLWPRSECQCNICFLLPTKNYFTLVLVTSYLSGLHFNILGISKMDGRRPLRVPVKYRRRSKKTTITSSSSSSEDDKDHDIHLLDVLTDVQKFLGHLNREHLTQGCRSMTQNLATKIDHVTRRSKSKSR